MHVLFITFDRNTLLKIIFTVLISALGLLHLIKNFAFKYSEIHTNFNKMTLDQPCFVCGNPSNKQCSRCKSVRYCSQECQSKDWRSGHKNNCKKIACSNKSKSTSLTEGLKGSFGWSTSAGIFPVPANGGSEVIKTKKVLYPYDEFVMLFNLDMPGFPPCGLLNCGNSCFANVVLQCLSFTRPLTAYLLKKGHRITCKRNDWCFLCEFQDHVESVSRNCQPFSPINIFSRLSNIGGNFGCGSQEDAHEFMRFAIDTMQSNCLDEFGGERTVHHNSQETTLIQHIFGGQLQSQVNCSLCNKESDLFENIMDLTVEIHDASTLEESLHQFTDKEWLYGDNMYKCDRCNDYVKAWKRLTIQTPPNILTIALKRFQSGTFGKLNKKVTFPETLDLSPYMSEAGDGTDVYKLYAVVVHLDMLNVSSFGHYICYAKDFHGNWYLIDDYKVKPVSLEEVLSQKAYMLLYSRVSARPSCLKAAEHLEIEKEKVTVEPCSRKQNGSFAPDPPCSFLSSCEGELSIADYFEPTRGLGHPDVDIPSSNLSLSQESFEYEYVSSSATSSDIFSDMNEEDTPMSSSPILKEIPRQEEELSILNNVGTAKRAKQMTVADPASLSVACCSEEEPGAMGEKSENADLIKSKLSAASTNNLKVCSNGHDTMDCDGSLREAQDIVPSSFHSSDETSERRITSYS